MGKQKDASKKPGRQSKWSPERHEFLMSHVETYLNTDTAQKAAFWRTFFPLWFARFPTADGTPSPSLWSSLIEMPQDPQDQSDHDENNPQAPRHGKKKRMGEMSRDEATIQVRFPSTC